MSSGRSPTMIRRQLGLELRRLREAAGLTLEEASKRLHASESKLSRIETGKTRAALDDIGRMLDLYQASPEQRNALLNVGEEARRDPWWQNYFGTRIVPMVGWETAASRIHQYETMIVPALLQTESYARAVITAGRPDLPHEHIDRWVRLRMARQAFLVRDYSPALWVVLEESVLRRPVGGYSVMREQLQRLIKAAESPNVTLQILPFGVGEHMGIGGAFTIYGFADPSDSTVVYIEHIASDLYLENADKTSQYEFAFDRLRKLSFNPQDSIDFVTVLANHL